MHRPDKSLELDVLISNGTEPTLVNQTGLWRFLTPVREEKLAPCRQNCPLGSGVSRWIEKVREKDWAGAWEIMEQYNPFPALTGYACYRYCQDECNRRYYDEAIDIGEIEKAIGLWKLEQGEMVEQENLEKEKSKAVYKSEEKSVAVIGSGPAGLSAAYYLNRLGIHVKVFEKLPAAGGLLTAGIPPERLPREILSQELKRLEQQGITFETGVEVGQDISLDTLKGKFDAVFFAVGAQERRFLGVPGETLPGVFAAIAFLQRLYLAAGSAPRLNHKKVLVFGGGNAALDAATAAVGQGSEEVWVVYRRGREEMPAHESEVKAAEEAGVRFLYHRRLVEIIGEGAVEGVRLVETRPSRRGESVSDVDGSGHDLPCSAVILAAGSESGLKSMFADGLSRSVLYYGTQLLQVLDIPDFTDHEMICLATGDAATGPQNIALAIAGGRLAARYLVEHFFGKETWQTVFQSDEPQEKAAPVVGYEQISPHYYPLRGKQSQPQDEAERCFSCGLCSRCGLCWFFCPDVSVEKESGQFEFLLDYCKGCGICAAECPAGVLEMKALKHHTTARGAESALRSTRQEYWR